MYPQRHVVFRCSFIAELSYFLPATLYVLLAVSIALVIVLLVRITVVRVGLYRFLIQ